MTIIGIVNEIGQTLKFQRLYRIVTEQSGLSGVYYTVYL